MIDNFGGIEDAIKYFQNKTEKYEVKYYGKELSPGAEIIPKKTIKNHDVSRERFKVFSLSRTNMLHMKY